MTRGGVVEWHGVHFSTPRIPVEVIDTGVYERFH
jgi:hypothetical protein